MQDLLTKKDIQILTFIVEGGGIDVSVAASSVNQNKNFYMRVRKMENLCLFNRKKFDGEPSSFTLTSKGKQTYNEILTSLQKEAQTC